MVVIICLYDFKLEPVKRGSGLGISILSTSKGVLSDNEARTENVGGEILDIVLGQIAYGARVVLCGGTSQYNNDLDWYGPKNYFNLVYKQAEMHGYYVQNFKHRYEEAHSVLGEMFRDGRMSYNEDILDGIESMPLQLIRILKGENFGIPLVRIS